MTFAQKIKAIRLASNLTQAEFAKTLRLGRSNYANIESGKNNPTPPLVNLIAIKYSIEEKWLLDDSDCRPCELANDDSLIVLERFSKFPSNLKSIAESQIDSLLTYYESELK